MSRRESRRDITRESRIRHDTTRSLLTSDVRVTLSETTSSARASAHPAICRVCRGSGWAEGPPIPVRQNGEPHELSTVQPCEHKWWWDEPVSDEPVSLDEYRRRLSARAARGDRAAAAELSVWLRPRGPCPNLTADG